MFYAKLAWSNLKKSISVFAPFLLTSTVLFLLICSTLLILVSPIGRNLSIGTTLLGLAVFILFIFSIIMEIYSYNFLLKQRSREYGLYTILGMNRSQLSLVSTIELAIVFLGIIILGSILSAIFSQLFYLIFINIIHYNQLVLTLSPLAFIGTICVFAFIFFILEIIALYNIRKSAPLNLFKKQAEGEKEPRGNILLALLSLICLGGGYYLSLSSTKVVPINLIGRFFIAVLLVIIGTYLFYISFVAWYFKRRRKNKRYFYQPEHFITTSQMIFRMKQHATGLANITILAVMAFVTVATTSSLYVNTQSQANHLFPKNTKIEITDSKDRKTAEDFFKSSVIDRLDYPKEHYTTYYTLRTMVPLSSDKKITIDSQNIDFSKVAVLFIMTQDDFKSLGNELSHLKSNQTAFYVQKGNSHLERLTLFGKTFDNVRNFKTVRFPSVTNTYNPALLIVSDDSVLTDVQKRFTQNDFRVISEFTGYANLSKADSQKITTESGVVANDTGLYLDSDGNSLTGEIEQKSTFLEEMYSFTGGFLFTGFLLGISFLLGAALIIYYKQRSEGIEDKKSYQILQEVGMGVKEIKRSINSQILLVFFMPLGFAILDFAVALVMLKQMLSLFGVTSSSMIYTVSSMTIVGIILIYFFIYKLTSKTYYKIIER